MEKLLRNFVLIFIATTLLLSSLIAARSHFSRNVQPPIGGNFLGKFSSFHRPWYGGRREADLPEKVFETEKKNPYPFFY